jgi:hypothetical protein
MGPVSSIVLLITTQCTGFGLAGGSSVYAHPAMQLTFSLSLGRHATINFDQTYINGVAINARDRTALYDFT